MGLGRGLPARANGPMAARAARWRGRWLLALDSECCILECSTEDPLPGLHDVV